MLHGVLLADEAAEHLCLRAGKADDAPVQQLLRAALRSVLAAAHAARHTQAELILLRVDGQALLAALAAHDRARSGQGKNASALNDTLAARRTEITDGTHLFFHLISSRKANL